MQNDLELLWLIGRIANCVLGTAALVMLTIAVRRTGWRFRTPGLRFHTLGIALLLFTTVYGSIEQVLQENRGGWRIILFTVALSYMTAGIYSRLKGRWRVEDDRTPDPR